MDKLSYRERVTQQGIRKLVHPAYWQTYWAHTTPAALRARPEILRNRNLFAEATCLRLIRNFGASDLQHLMLNHKPQRCDHLEWYTGKFAQSPGQLMNTKFYMVMFHNYNVDPLLNYYWESKGFQRLPRMYLNTAMSYQMNAPTRSELVKRLEAIFLNQTPSIQFPEALWSPK